MMGEDLNYAIFLYGVFFLRGKEDGFIGTTCPSCVETIYVRFDKAEFDFIAEQCLLFNFRRKTHYQPLRYFSPFIAYNEIIKLENCYTDIYPDAHDKELEIILNELSISKSNDILGIYQSYMSDIGDTAGHFFYNLWITEKQIKHLLNFEKESNLNLIPRYVFNNTTLEMVEKFSWIHNNRNIYIEKMDESYSLITKHIIKNNDFFSVPEFHDILTSNIEPWFSASISDKECVKFWKQHAPFYGTTPSCLFSDHAINDTPTEDIDDSIYVKLSANFKNGYSIDFLLKSAKPFIDEYNKIITRTIWSFAQIRTLIKRYTSEYDNAVNIGIRKNASYAFYRINNRYRIVFNNIELPDSNLAGLMYLHFLVKNEGKKIKHNNLNRLKGIDVHDLAETYNALKSKFGHDEFHIAGESVYYEDLQSNDGDSRFEISDDQATNEYEKELLRLKTELSQAQRDLDSNKSESIEKEINRLMAFLKNSHERSGRSRREGGEYRKLQKKIGKAIQYAIDWMDKQGFEEAYKHFSSSVDPYANEVVYSSCDAKIVWHT